MAASFTSPGGYPRPAGRFPGTIRPDPGPEIGGSQNSGADRLPVLSASSVRLRGFEPGDLGLVEQAAEDPYIPLISSVPFPYRSDAGRQFIERQRHRLGDGYGYSYVVTEQATGTAVGSAGLWLRDLDLGRASIGYWILATARGRGLGAQALSALTRFAFDRLLVPRLELMIEPWNQASLRTAERGGFVREGVLRQFQLVGARRRDMALYARLLEDA
jgi:[ribosomal protein S5]-alanine N-acetyltransferase